MNRDWVEKAKQLRACGMTYKQVGQQVGRCETTVRRALLEDITGKRIPGSYYGLMPQDAARPKPHKYRTPKQIVPREVIAEATLAFARGKIDRAELMRRITPAGTACNEV